MGRPTVVALKSNSVFDWADGSERSGGDDLDLPAVHKTRYNPNPRIGDITDLVEESSDDDIDNSIFFIIACYTILRKFAKGFKFCACLCMYRKKVS